MKPDIRWLDDPRVFRVGQLPAHSDHEIYADTGELEQGKSSLLQSLDGSWEFRYVRLAAHVSNGLKSQIRPVVGRI